MPVGPQSVRHVQETTETETDDSDSEYGAVGGVSHAEAASQRRVSPNSALKTEIVSEISNKTNKEPKGPVSKTKRVTKEIVAKKETVARDVAKEDTVAKEVAKGADNGAFEVDSDNSDSTYATDSSTEVYFPDSNKKDEKKVNHVV